MNAKRRTTIILALIILLILLTCLLTIFYQTKNAAPARIAEIYQKDTLIQRIDLSKVKKSYTITINAPDGGYNTILVEPGKIGISDADCPDKICEKMGMIDSSTYPISCLPHQLLIKIIPGSTSGQTSPDALAG